MDSASSMTGWTTLTADQNHNLGCMFDHLNQAAEGWGENKKKIIQNKKKENENTVLGFLKIKKQA